MEIIQRVQNKILNMIFSSSRYNKGAYSKICKQHQDKSSFKNLYRTTNSHRLNRLHPLHLFIDNFVLLFSIFYFNC